MGMYIYRGPVMEFDRIITKRWCGTTEAISEKKARSNLAYQFKQEYKRTPNSKITLPGKMVAV